MDPIQGAYQLTRLTYQQLQSLARHGPCSREADGLAGVDFRRLLSGWAAAIDPDADELGSGYLFWLGGDSIHYQAFNPNEVASQPKESLGQVDCPGDFFHD